MFDSARLALIFRARGVEFSMEKVFEAIFPQLLTSISARKVYMPCYRFSIWGVLRNFLKTVSINSDIYHITGMVHYCVLFLPSNKTVVTIHDTFIFGSPLKKKILFYFFFYFPLKKAKYITCISETTKENLIQMCPFCASKIRVIYNPICPEYSFVSKSFNSVSPRILHIGTRSNKNLERVIEALKGIKCVLVIVGKLNKNQKKLLIDNSISYENKYNLTDEQIHDEYIKCDVVSFPSLFEGFGMPIIEGNAIGRAVLTSNINPMKEISNGSTQMVDPYSVESIRAGFMELFCDKNLRNELVRKGLENIKKFEPTKIAKEYCEVYWEILNRKLE